MITRQEYEEAEARVSAVAASLGRARMDRADAGLVIDEVRSAAAMLRHACRRGRWLLGRASEDAPEDAADLARDLSKIIDEHRRLWLARNRPGGLRDSVARLAPPLADYAVPQ